MGNNPSVCRLGIIRLSNSAGYRACQNMTLHEDPFNEKMYVRASWVEDWRGGAHLPKFRHKNLPVSHSDYFLSSELSQFSKVHLFVKAHCLLQHRGVRPWTRVQLTTRHSHVKLELKLEMFTKRQPTGDPYISNMRACLLYFVIEVGFYLECVAYYHMDYLQILGRSTFPLFVLSDVTQAQAQASSLMDLLLNLDVPFWIYRG